MTAITQYQHGDPEMFRLLGPYFCSKAVHKELGEPIHSDEKTTWFVATEKGRVVGFCSMRNTSKVILYGYGYVDPDYRDRGIFTKLSDARDKVAATLNKPMKVVVRETRWHHYEKRCWNVATRRGSWIYGVHDEL
jgi:GNAT superfamily N-acetyltransferase